ncbi:MAG TPA: dienelactone hydrolase family protein [Gemmatimonadales bacterium]|nr:dienelactone hydrolase family protein [Gemmatimonadales bacterium]
MIMIHGRGAGPANILDLVPQLEHPDFTYLAPAAAGGTWYPFSFMAEIERNEPGITSGLAAIHRLVNDVEGTGIPKSRIFLLGFSQGACLTSTYAVSHPARYGGVIIFTGGLIGPPGTRWDPVGAFGGTPVFLGSSDVDPHVPASRVHQSAEVFRQMGAEVTERIYPGMGHLVNEDEIAFTQSLMRGI